MDDSDGDEFYDPEGGKVFGVVENVEEEESSGEEEEEEDTDEFHMDSSYKQEKCRIGRNIPIVPRVRICPMFDCGSDCVHGGACKHSRCGNRICGYWFCHVCLRVSDPLVKDEDSSAIYENGVKWGCGNGTSFAYSACPERPGTNKEGVFPVQTEENSHLWKVYYFDRQNVLRYIYDGSEDSFRFVKESFSKSTPKPSLTEFDEEGCNWIHHAALANNVKTLRFLVVFCGIDINLQHEITGETCVHISIKCGFPRILKFLFETGADITNKDLFGMTAFEYQNTVCPNVKSVQEIIKLREKCETNGAEEFKRLISVRKDMEFLLYPTSLNKTLKEKKIFERKHRKAVLISVVEGEIVSQKNIEISRLQKSLLNEQKNLEDSRRTVSREMEKGKRRLEYEISKFKIQLRRKVSEISNTMKMLSREQEANRVLRSKISKLEQEKRHREEVKALKLKWQEFQQRIKPATGAKPTNQKNDDDEDEEFPDVVEFYGGGSVVLPPASPDTPPQSRNVVYQPVMSQGGTYYDEINGIVAKKRYGGDYVFRCRRCRYCFMKSATERLSREFCQKCKVWNRFNFTVK